MSLFGFFQRRTTAPVARERLQILLAHERGNGSQSQLVAVLAGGNPGRHRPAHAD